MGNNLGTTTVYVYDATPGTGVTGLTVRAGQSQGAQPLQSWQTATGAEVGYVDAAGTLAAAAVRATGSATRAAWQEAGVATDPSTRNDGDSWYNTTQQARKGAAAGRVHTVPQVLCASTGASTNSTAHTRLGSCTFPADFLRPGDRVEIRFDYSHDGAAADFGIEVAWGGSIVLARIGALSESRLTGKAEVGVHADGAQFSVQSWGSNLALEAAAGEANDPLAIPIAVDFLGRMEATTTDTVTLRNFTVVRYPAQANP